MRALRSVANGVTAAAFDSRGAVLSAGPWLAEATPPPWRLQRYREMRRLDGSFGNRKLDAARVRLTPQDFGPTKPSSSATSALRET